MSDILMFGKPKSNEILEAQAKLSYHIGIIGLDRNSFFASYAKFGGRWSEDRKQMTWDFLLNICKGFEAILGTKKARNHLQPWRVFGFISDSLEINGIATRLFDAKLNAFYFGITAGALLTPYLIHARLAAQEAYFPEVPSIGPSQSFFLAEDEFVDLQASRLALSTSLSIVSAYTIFFHELAHILRGHIAHINDTGVTEAPHVLESASLGGGIKDIGRRSLETDADFYAGVWLAEFILSGRIPIAPLGVDLEERLPRIVMSVLVAYYGFHQTGQYHDGISRTYVVVAGLISRLNVNAKGAAETITAMLIDFADTMRSAGLAANDLDLEDMEVLVNETEPVLQNLVPDFVSKRPETWG